MKEKKKTITEEDVQAALGKFLRAGGLIRHLPDQVVPRNTLVGARWGMYEIVSDTTVASSGTHM